MQKKILGILGGMGPYTSLDFARNILEVTPAKKDWDHIRTIHDSNVDIPSRTRAILYDEESPVQGMIETINKLADYGAQVVVVPCNSAHYFYPQIKDHIKIKWLNILEIVSEKVKEANLSKTLILGGYVTIVKQTYSSYFNCVYLDDSQNQLVYDLIEALKLDDMTLSDSLAEDLAAIIIELQQKGTIDSVVLGCTELSVPKALKHFDDLVVFDTNSIYAKKAAEYCLG